MSSPNYFWGPELSPAGYSPLTPEDSPRSTNTNINYTGSDFSAHSGQSSHTSQRSKSSRGATIYINGQKVANVSSTSSSGHPSRRARRPSVVVTTNESELRPRYHSRSPLTPSTPEPEHIYIEENIGGGLPARPLIVDNRGRRTHRRVPSDAPRTTVRSQSRPRSRSRSMSRPTRQYSWSDEEIQQSRPPRKSSMKRSGSRRSRRQSVAFAVEDEIIEPLAAIRLQNDKIASRPAVLDAPFVPSDAAEPYIRGQVRARTYRSDDVERTERHRIKMEMKEEQARLDRLRRRQETPATAPPLSSRPVPSRRRNSVVVTAPPMGVYNPYVHHPPY